ncbi:MAG: hypothetical protein JKX97_08285 [Candidatus Lindowbacteria bacterium]|nr:hypothetical protein [Candidatus Lindowbacteria bacterium]
MVRVRIGKFISVFALFLLGMVFGGAFGNKADAISDQAPRVTLLAMRGNSTVLMDQNTGDIWQYSSDMQNEPQYLGKLTQLGKKVDQNRSIRKTRAIRLENCIDSWIGRTNKALKSYFAANLGNLPEVTRKKNIKKVIPRSFIKFDTMDGFELFYKGTTSDYKIYAERNGELIRVYNSATGMLTSGDLY